MNKVLVILGPTAVGKSKVALEIADKLNGEIVSADSRQLYRYMDIGTAKPSREEQNKVFHHLIDILNPDERFSAADYAKQARVAIEEIFKRNKQPIVVGGSGLYIRALMEGFFEGPSADVRIRKQLKQLATDYGKMHLHNKLKTIDPISAHRIHPNDTKKIIRALEVYQLTGMVLSQLQKKEDNVLSGLMFVKTGLNLERKKLYQKINQRVDEMLHKGLLEEVEKLSQMGYTRQLNALNTVGYKEMFSYLQGEITLGEAIAKIKQNTRNYAKRQMTWFKKDREIVWFDADELDLIDKMAAFFRSHI